MLGIVSVRKHECSGKTCDNRSDHLLSIQHCNYREETCCVRLYAYSSIYSIRQGTVLSIVYVGILRAVFINSKT